MWISIVVFFVVWAYLLRLHRDYYFLQYLYYLRYPVLLALAMVVLPVTALDWVGKPFRNLFVFDGPWALAAVTLLTLFVAWQVMFCAGLLYEHSAHRVKLRYRRHQPDNAPWRNHVPTLLQPRWRRLIIFSALALPIIAASAIFSLAGAPETITSDRTAMSLGDVVVGIMSAFGMAFLLAWIVDSTEKLRWAQLSHLGYWVLVRPTAFIDRYFFGKTTIETDQRKRIKKASNFVFRTEMALPYFAIALALYFVIRIRAPEEGGLVGPFEYPAIVYVLLLMMLITWILSWLSHLFDRHRLVTETVLIPLFAISYFVFDTDHHFSVLKQDIWTTATCPTIEARDSNKVPLRNALETTPAELLQARRERSGFEGRPIIVATSGGGITAAYWTAVVLTELEKSVIISENLGFSDIVVGLSGTSGGSVGSLYYLDAFDAKDEKPRPFNANELRRIREAASTSSLSAIGWGLVYRDFWRVVFPPFADRLEDRASAMETRWRQSLPSNQLRWEVPKPPDPQEAFDPTFAEWAEGVREGWRPAAVFNATLVESGELLQIANVALPRHMRTTVTDAIDGDDTLYREHTFGELNPGADISAVTAARLSATFPWISPVARPNLDETCANLYHVADGGYFDNFGVLSALTLAEALPEGEEPILVEIRSSDTSSRPEPDVDVGFTMVALGPLKTLMAVRSASQLGRNETLVHRAIREGRLSTRVVFELRQDAPLSWHLSDREVQEIEAGWQADHVQASQRKLCNRLDLPCGTQ